MFEPVDSFSSLLTTLARGGKGLMVRQAAMDVPERMLVLYDMEGCPFCRLVREELTELDLDALIYPCPKNGKRFRPLVEKRVGRAQFPLLEDPNTSESLLESQAIIRYLRKQYAGRKNSSAVFRGPAVISSVFGSMFRPGKGVYARASRAPEKPLVLYSFEASPYCRRVREVLSELEIPYELHNLGKGALFDFVGPELRKNLFRSRDESTVKRQGLADRAGAMKVPYLIDPNTGKEMYESSTIIRYLNEHYAA